MEKGDALTIVEGVTWETVRATAYWVSRFTPDKQWKTMKIRNGIKVYCV